MRKLGLFFLATTAGIVGFHSLSIAATSNSTTTTAPISSSAPAVDPSQYKLEISPGIGNINQLGQPIISIDKNPADWKQNAATPVAPATPIMPQTQLPPRLQAPGQLRPWAECFNLEPQIKICGQNIPSPPPSNAFFAEGIVPPPYAPDHFTAICILNYKGKLIPSIDTTQVTCKHFPCQTSAISVCGITLPVLGADVGSTVPIPVPDNAFPQSTVKHDLTVMAQCVVDDANQAVYRADTSHISCNQFACQDALVNLCNTPIPVEGGAAMGEVLHLTMPSPFTPDPFTVQCVGSGGNAPSYQVTDHSGVTCGSLQP